MPNDHETPTQIIQKLRAELRDLGTLALIGAGGFVLFMLVKVATAGAV